MKCPEETIYTKKKQTGVFGVKNGNKGARKMTQRQHGSRP